MDNTDLYMNLLDWHFKWPQEFKLVKNETIKNKPPAPVNIPSFFSLLYVVFFAMSTFHMQNLECQCYFFRFTFPVLFSFPSLQFSFNPYSSSIF